MLVELDVDVTYSVSGTFEIPDELAEQLDFGEVDCRLPLFEWLPNIKYVHELQHALRLCGINKEIENIYKKNFGL